MLIDDGGLFLAGLVDKGGCSVRCATGVFFWLFSGKQQQWVITSDLCKPFNYLSEQHCIPHSTIAGSKVISQGNTAVNANQWYSLSLNVQVRYIAYCLRLEDTAMYNPLLLMPPLHIL